MPTKTAEVWIENKGPSDYFILEFYLDGKFIKSRYVYIPGYSTYKVEQSFNCDYGYHRLTVILYDSSYKFLDSKTTTFYVSRPSTPTPPPSKPVKGSVKILWIHSRTDGFHGTAKVTWEGGPATIKIYVNGTYVTSRTNSNSSGTWYPSFFIPASKLKSGWNKVEVKLYVGGKYVASDSEWEYY